MELKAPVQDQLIQRHRQEEELTEWEGATKDEDTWGPLETAPWCVF